MSKTIEGIPESLTREQYLSLIQGAGFESTENMTKLEFRTDGIYVEMHAVNDKGNALLDSQADETCKHRIYIPVVG